jgi:hypothetical protein
MQHKAWSELLKWFPACSTRLAVSDANKMRMVSSAGANISRVLQSCVYARVHMWCEKARASVLLWWVSGAKQSESRPDARCYSAHIDKTPSSRLGRQAACRSGGVAISIHSWALVSHHSLCLLFPCRARPDELIEHHGVNNLWITRRKKAEWERKREEFGWSLVVCANVYSTKCF